MVAEAAAETEAAEAGEAEETLDTTDLTLILDPEEVEER